MIRIGRSLGCGVAFLSAVGLFAACGSDSGGSSRGGSLASIQNAIESPTGTVNATTAADVGAEFGRATRVNTAGGTRRDMQTAQTQSGTSPCAESGSVSGTESNGEVTVSYDACCMDEACCMDGNSHMFSSSDQNAPYMFCASYDVTWDCDGASRVMEFESCMSSEGEQLLVLEVNGDTYTVSGYYSEGSGSLEIRGANGTWTCTYSGSGGSCTGNGSFEF